MSLVSPQARGAIFIGAWLVWFSGLAALRKHELQKPVQIDLRARWGMAFQGCGYFLVCLHTPLYWSSNLPIWRAITGIGFALVSTFLFRGAVASLGRQWRFDAGLNRDHELVRTGAYRVVRHPIYASMLGMMLLDVCLAGTLPGWPIALALFLAGTEIRVHVEDELLKERFGERFTEWQRSVRAYLPFVR
jgi:protein-S-isoprenylcysteine O-methyltransferase Ste14